MAEQTYNFTGIADAPPTPRYNLAGVDDATPGGVGTRFAEGAWKNLNPIGLVKAAVHPIDTLGALIDAQLDQFKQAKTAYDNGHYENAFNTVLSLSDVAGHVGAGLLPLVGPPAARAGERIGSGDIAGGLGEATGLIAATQAPKVVPKVVGATARGVAKAAPVLAQPAWGTLADLVGIFKPNYANGMRLAQRAEQATSQTAASPPVVAPPAAAPAPPPAAPPIPPGTGTSMTPLVGVSAAPPAWQGNVGAFVNQFPRPAAAAPAAASAAAPAAAAAAPALTAVEQATATLTDAGMSAARATKTVASWTRQGVTDLMRAAEHYADSFLKD